jgi:capsular polysaccharide transport system ATP-binding protein
MIVEFQGVRKRTRKTIRPVVFDNLNFRIEDGAHVAFLGHVDSGLDSLLDLICGADAPDAGFVRRGRKISWPIPDTGFMHKHRSIGASTQFIAQLYEVEPRAYFEKVVELAGLQEFVGERLDHCPRSALSRLAFALGACLPFEVFILTNTKFGDKTEGDRIGDHMRDLIRSRGLLLATSQGKAALEYCDSAYVLDSGTAVYYDDMEAAIEHLDSIEPKRAEAETADGEEDDQERTFDDF